MKGSFVTFISKSGNSSEIVSEHLSLPYIFQFPWTANLDFLLLFWSFLTWHENHP